MVKITPELLTKCPSQSNKKRGENPPQYLKRLTHVYLAERLIDEIDNLSLCRNLSVLYLYDNCISKIENLDFAVNLTHLYLQKNKITKIEGLSNLKRLSKLYLGHNSITVVEGLENLPELSELHVEYQQLPVGEKLLFDPRSLKAVSKSLNVLNISGNNIDHLHELHCLSGLIQLNAEHNDIQEIKELLKSLSIWPSILRLDLVGNPVCEKKKYRDRIFVMSNTLVMLDGKEISATAKKFLINWKANREARKRQLIEKEKQRQQQVIQPEPTDTNSTIYFQAIPPMLPQLHGVSTRALALSASTRDSFSKNITGTGFHQMQQSASSRSRFPNIYSSQRQISSRGTWTTEGGRHPVPLQTVLL